MSTTLQPWQQRVVDEKRDLDARLGRLRDFMRTEAFAAVDWPERDRLTLQEAFMAGYSRTLEMRIRAFR